MKILHIASSLGGGGKERRLVQLIAGMHNISGFDSELVIQTNVINYPEIYDYRVKVMVLEKSNRIGILRQLHHIIKEEKPDIVHAWVERPSMLFVISIWKYICGYKLVLALANANPIEGFFNKFCYHIAFHSANKIVSNSQAGLIAKESPEEKSLVIYNGFNFDRIKNISSINVTEVKKQFDISTKYVVTMFARFHSARDYSSFINLAEWVGKSRNDVTFLGVGMGEMLGGYKKEVSARGLKNIRLGGFVQDITSLLAITDVSVLFTSKQAQEGLSNSIMESMAAGRPTIATRSGGTPEIITDNIDGFIIEPEDYKTAGGRLISLLDDAPLYNRLSQAAKAKIQSKFLLSNMVDRYVELYKSLR